MHALALRRPCNSLRLNGLTHVNSPRVHVTITACNNVIISNLRIIAPETSPNTDGINIASSTNVKIRDSIIGTGDDCVAISGGSSNIMISGIMCGPGHGISIGALGNGGTDVVENIEVRNCTMVKTLAGVRIKSWQVGLVTLVLVLLTCMISSAFGSTGLSRINLESTTTFNVMKYGATGNGKTDDSPAFSEAWKAACQAQPNDKSILVIPAGKTFLLKPISFNGPCKPSRIYVQVSGTILGPTKKTDWTGYHIDTWLLFSMVDGLTVSGNGRIDGQGPIWWENACIGSPAPLISNQLFSSSCITLGDDCIAIGGGSSNIKISGIMCGPGHGISIGALGHSGADVVENIDVRNCTMIKTLTGVRIKTWQGGSGHAKQISFTGIKFDAVYNPIIIDQYYCPNRKDCLNSTSAVKLSDITYKGIAGTSSMDNVINLSCSESVACTNIVMDSVYISSATPGRKVFGSCINAHGRLSHVKPFLKCLQP
ncbi:Glycoside hydrolase, family 28 [Cynara cardunculus var. scolymus]|uniref:Glycoside hydrolase, family 28 n=1 Tax=Cynara cardunculus var. scolymus TaxID=59895 RepID=A0A103XLU9_CYNCS|nr:Glycoside hydrolase, family 28 [Cynara cardunculus var. scolymus]